MAGPLSPLEVLRSVELLAGLPEPALLALVERVSLIEVAAGTTLFVAGDEADRLFVVAHGRLEIELVGGARIALGPGGVVGELALLTGGRRAATVRVRRDARLVELMREDVDDLLAQPTFARALAASLGRQLSASRPAWRAAGGPTVVALMALDSVAPVDAVADALAAELEGFDTVAVLRPEAGAGDGDAERLAGAERFARHVLLVDDGASSTWSDFCARQADRVLALVGGPAPPPESPGAAPALRTRRCEDVELVACGEATPGPVVAAWERLVSPRSFQPLRAGSRDAGVVRLARRLAGRSIGLVLSGGGARGFAHFGVIAELRAAGIEIDRAAGTSQGAVIAASVANGTPTETMIEAAREFYLRRNPVKDVTIPLASIVRGRRTMKGLRSGFGDLRIEELPRPFACVSCDLVERRLVVHDRGDLALALRATVGLPGVFPPLAGNGQLLVDGGVMDNLPIDGMAARGEGPVVAVDVGGTSAAAPEGRPGLLTRLLTGSALPVPSLGETLVRTITLGSADTAAAAERHASVFIRPAVAGIGVVEWTAIDRAVEAGRRAARDVLASLPPGTL